VEAELAVNIERHEKPKDSYLEGLIYLRNHFLPASTVAVFIVVSMYLAVEVLDRFY
jgi:hypothetical protein